MSEPDAIQNEMIAMPPVLRTLLEAELAAGNEIVEVGHTFPAPPVGAYFKLAKPLLTRARQSGEGIDYHDRHGPAYSGEITDAKRFYFLLEPPHPPEPPPDMDAIRAARLTPLPLPRQMVLPRETSGSSDVPVDYTVEVDCRGEMLTYCELNRSANVICTFGSTQHLVPRTLSNWHYPIGQRFERMSEAEKKVIIDRIADYCRKHHRMTNLVLEM